MRKFKPAQSDFTPSMLPQTRYAVFCDAIKLQWPRLLLLGALLLLFFLPLLFSILVKDIYIANFYQSISQEDASTGNVLIILEVLRSGINILFLGILAVGLSAVTRVIRQFSWGENVHLPTDLLKGLRDNFSQTAGVCMLAGLIYTLCLTVYYSAGSYKSGLVGAVMLLPITLSVLFALPILAVALVMIPIYSNRFFGTLKNAFYVYCRSVPRLLPGLIGCLSPWIVSLIPNFYCHIFGCIGAIMLTPISLLAWTLMCYNFFDKHINPQVAPELIGKGIVWETE